MEICVALQRSTNLARERLDAADNATILASAAALFLVDKVEP